MPDVRDDPKLNRTAEHYSKLLSLAVHEFRTPASVVSGYLRMLQRDSDPTLSERQRKMVDEAGKSCARIIAIVDELSDIGKLDGGLISLAKQPLDLFTLIKEVAELVHEAEDREVHLKLRGDDHGAPIAGDVPRLRVAFDAIFRAILREKPGRSTVIADRRLVSRDGRTSAVVIVSEEATVQEAYDREPVSFFEKRGGLGLALPLAGRVIEGHGGRLSSPKPLLEDDPLTRGSAINSQPITELKR
jgi:light-regulated signal transduction histidine kinase (bacteriophytochrome)